MPPAMDRRILLILLALTPLVALPAAPTSAAVGTCASYSGVPCPTVCLEDEWVTLRVTGPGWVVFSGCGISVSIACAGGNRCEHSFGPLQYGAATCRGSPSATCHTAW